MKLLRSFLLMTHKRISLFFCAGLVLAGAFACRAAQAQQIPIDSRQNPFLGSVPNGKATTGTLRLTLRAAVDRGLRANLGLLLSGEETQAARGERWQALSRLLPVVEGAVSASQQEINLKSMVGPNTLPPTFPSTAGPFHVFDARAYVSVPLLNMSALDAERSAFQRAASATYSYRDARDTVVLAVGNTYLTAIAGKARVDAARAELSTAQALYQLALDRDRAGLSPEIDTLRALVELKSRQENLLAAENDYATEKLNLARVIGLPNSQALQLATQVPFKPMPDEALEEALAQAYRHRSDYQAALSQVASAQAALRSAQAERYPSIGLNANWGGIGTESSDAHQTYAIAGTLRIPIFQGRRVHGEVMAAGARLRQTQARLANLKEQIDYDVRTALMNLKTDASQVTVAETNTTLATRTLEQARDRFASGVADNIEVVQAQQTMAQAEETYIASLYRYNFSKLNLARAIGVAESDGLEYLGEKKP
jgi:outer membrane protein TolC